MRDPAFLRVVSRAGALWGTGWAAWSELQRVKLGADETEALSAIT
jgi:hypothetical protein